MGLYRQIRTESDSENVLEEIETVGLSGWGLGRISFGYDVWLYEVTMEASLSATAILYSSSPKTYG